jgi:fructose-1,6-bisphosphatase II / sedoheptulose-1,7-bisphosphatase
MDRPPHDDIIAAVRGAGAAVRPISDGDVAGVIYTADPDNSGVDIYTSTGGAPEGVLAVAAPRCIRGQMQCRLVLDTDEKRERAARMVLATAEDILDRRRGEGRLPICGDWRYRRCTGVGCQVS